MKSVVAHTVEVKDGSLLLECSYAGIVDRFLTDNFYEAIDWLSTYYPNSFYVCWNLADFAESLFKLLPPNAKKDGNRIYAGDTKIFYVDRMLGINRRKHASGNFYHESDINLYGIDKFFDYESPANVVEVEAIGNRTLKTLDRMGLNPSKLTSPAGVYAEELDNYTMPTNHSNPEIIDASAYAEIMCQREWRSAYKIGYFESSYLYDMVMAYPSIMVNLPSTDRCKLKYDTQWLKCDWGLVKAKVNVTKDFSPIVYDNNDGYILPLGERVDIFTTEEIKWLACHKSATFEIIDGWFFLFDSTIKPYKAAIEKIYNTRLEGDADMAYLAKRIGHGISGKLDQSNADGTLGELYNPILAAMTRSRCRIAVADFIHNLAIQDSVIAVTVDSVLTDRELGIEVSGKLGGWRYEGKFPALVLGKGEIWRPDKKPLGISMSEIIEAMENQPQASYWKLKSGKELEIAALGSDCDRIYDTFPATGWEALSRVSGSKPPTI